MYVPGIKLVLYANPERISNKFLMVIFPNFLSLFKSSGIYSVMASSMLKINPSSMAAPIKKEINDLAIDCEWK